MKALLPSLRTQLALVLIAAAVAAIAGVLLIREVLTNTEGLLVREARGQTELAAEQLRYQLSERIEIDIDSPLALPPPVRDLSLGAITHTVLGSFPSLEGGYWLGPEAGIAGTVLQVTNAEDAIASVCAAAARSGVARREQLAHGWDVWVLAAAPLAGDHAPFPVVAWSLRMLHDLNNPGRFRSNLYLGLLAATGLLAVGGTLAVAVRLRRQVDATVGGVRNLEKDLTFRFSSSTGEFGEITEAINRMAGQRLELEQELRRKEILVALGRLVASVAHEVRNPLNNIQLLLELLTRDGASPSAETRYRQLRGEVERMEGIVQQLLTLVRHDASSRNAQCLQALLEGTLEAFAPYADKHGVTLAREFQPDLPDVPVHRAQIEQVFTNVLRNAIEASPPQSEIRVRLFRKHGHACVAVADSGRGIFAGDPRRVFEPFFSTKPQGVGLGLTISREIVEAHGGSIEFAQDETGTTVSVLLPLEASA